MDSSRFKEAVSVKRKMYQVMDYLKPLVFLLPVGISVPAAGEIVWDFNSSTPITIADIQNDPDGALRVGDKVFSDFEVITTATAGVTAPDASTIKVGGTNNFQNLGAIGLEFFGGWATSVGELINTTIRFRVTADFPFQLDGVGLALDSFASAGDGLIQIAENITNDNAPPDQLVIPPLFVQYAEGNPLNDFYDQDDILDQFGPQTSFNVAKDITVRDGASIEPGAAHLSAFSQGFFQTVIPEPGTAVVFAVAVTGLVGRRRRRA